MRSALEIIFFLSTVGILYSYVLYPCLLFVLSSVFGRPTRSLGESLPTVTVLIPAYNEEHIIGKKIKNVLALDYPPDRLTVRVGSDMSTDRTNEIVESFDPRRVVLWTAPRRGGKTEVLNQCVPLVDTDVVMLTDANTMHAPDCLRRLVSHFADPAVGAAAGHIEHRTPSQNTGYEETFYRSFETWQKRMESRLHSTISAFGGCYVIRKTLFRPIPFNSYSNDDVLIPMNVIRQGRRVVFDRDAVSWESLSDDTRMEFARRVRIGAGNFQAFFWLLDFLSPLKGWPAFCYVSHKASRWFSPIFICTAGFALAALTALTGLVAYKILSLMAVCALGAAVAFTLLRVRIFRPFYYFFLMNAALLLGLFRYAAGIRSAAWSRTDRRADTKD
jgi:cellulose synthase/poly-beta-1,6-N-acetylglucosamine synthase-like glycosyltransferase